MPGICGCGPVGVGVGVDVVVVGVSPGTPTQTQYPAHILVHSTELRQSGPPQPLGWGEELT